MRGTLCDAWHIVNAQYVIVIINIFPSTVDGRTVWFWVGLSHTECLVGGLQGQGVFQCLGSSYFKASFTCCEGFHGHWKPGHSPHWTDKGLRSWGNFVGKYWDPSSGIFQMYLPLLENQVFYCGPRVTNYLTKKRQSMIQSVLKRKPLRA